jgi:hypothetical protein
MKVAGKIAAGYDSSDAAAACVQGRVNAAIARRQTNLHASTGLEEPVSLAARSCWINRPLKQLRRCRRWGSWGTCGAGVR